jgi:hypothetical protein
MLQFRMSIDTMRGRVQLSAREVNEQTAAKIAGHFIRIGAVLDEEGVERNGSRISRNGHDFVKMGN